MKNVVIGSLVAAVIVFVYQALSWMVLPIHEGTLKYTPQQDAILSVLSANLNEDGVYALPNLPPGSTQQERSEFDKSMVGKPWAVVHYHATYGGMMGSQLLWGLIIDLIAALVIGYVMWTARGVFAGFAARFSLALGFALFTVFQSSLMMANWWEVPGHYLSGEIIDHLLGWALAGVWFGWWFGRKATT
jgi:hypothetical protein